MCISAAFLVASSVIGCLLIQFPKLTEDSIESVFVIDTLQEIDVYVSILGLFVILILLMQNVKYLEVSNPDLPKT